MYTTVREALDVLLRGVGEVGDSQARQVALDVLNSAVHKIWLAHAWQDFESPSPFEVTLTAGRSRYALPSQAGRILRPVVNRSRKGQRLEEASKDETAERFPGMGTSTAPTGAPTHYRVIGITQAFRQPLVSGEVLEVVSDSATDTTVEVTVTGDDANGIQRVKRVTLTGTSPVTLGTFSFVDEFAKAYDAAVVPAAGRSSAGTVTLRTTDGVVLQALDADEGAREHQILQFFPTPDAADVIAVPFMRRQRLLVGDSDSLPGDWWRAIEEEWLLGWRVNTGELASSANEPRPILRAMIEEDNLRRPRPQRMPFAGGFGR